MPDARSLIEKIDTLLPLRPEEALEYCRELRSIALERRIYELLIQEEGLRGRSYFAESRNQEGRKFLSQAVTWYRQRHKPEPGSLLINSVGADFLQLSRFPEARLWLAAAVQNAVTSKLPRVLYKSLYNLGKVEQRSGNLAAARDYFERSLATAHTVHEAVTHRGVLLQSLASVSSGLGDLRKTEKYLHAGQQEALRLGQWERSLSMAREISRQMIVQREYHQARVLLFQSMETAREHGLVREELLVSISLAQVLFRLDQRGVLLQVLLRGQRLLEEHQDLRDRETAELYKYLAVSYEKIFNDQDRSSRYYQLYRYFSGLKDRGDAL